MIPFKRCSSYLHVSFTGKFCEKPCSCPYFDTIGLVDIGYRLSFYKHVYFVHAKLNNGTIATFYSNNNNNNKKIEILRIIHVKC